MKCCPGKIFAKEKVNIFLTGGYKTVRRDSSHCVFFFFVSKDKTLKNEWVLNETCIVPFLVLNA